MDKQSLAREAGGMLTTGCLIDSFLAASTVAVRLGQSAEATHTFYRFQLKKLRSAAERFPAAELRPHHLINVEFTNHFLRAVKRLFRWAVEEELVPKDVWRKLKTPPTGQRTRTLEDAEVVRLYRHAGRAFRRPLFAMLHSIARPGEIRGLKWGQIDFGRRCIVLTKFKAKDKRKDGKKVRLIPLDGPLTRWLLRERILQCDPDATAHVFRMNDGRPWTANGWRCAMRTARRRAGLNDGERVVSYTMRHTGATKAVRNGVQETALADVMGHTTTAMTRRYLHRSPADLVQVIEQATGGK